VTDEQIIRDIQRPEFRLIVTGSRRFCCYKTVSENIERVVSKKKETHSIVIVSGDCQGPDTLARAHALENGYRIELMEYDPSLGRNASASRHQRMADVADGILAFWDGKSEGTDKLLSLMYKMGKAIRVMEVDCVYQCGNRFIDYRPEESYA
jgi:hypothetical protein